VGCGTNTHRRGKKPHMLAGKPGEKKMLGNLSIDRGVKK
jgi:hypothetical protein